MTSHIRAVVFDFRGTLTTEYVGEGWAGEALRRVGRDYGDQASAALWQRIHAAAGEPNRLQDPTGNTSPVRHRDTLYAVFADAGLDDALADALLAVDSDLSCNLFAADVPDTFAALAGNGCAIGVLSNIHVDIRPTFAEAGLDEFVDAFVLSGEHGVQKPQPRIFEVMLDMLGTSPEQTLMVGDRASRDGAAVQVGMPTLLVPPLTDPSQRRLHLVTHTAAIPATPSLALR